MPDETYDRHCDVIQNVEYAILWAYENQPALLDLDVLDALDGLIRRYGAEEQNRLPPRLQLSLRASQVYAVAQHMCEWRLGRASFNSEDGDLVPEDQWSTVAEIVVCLKRIRKSVRLWNEQGGRLGYRDYLVNFFRQISRGV